MFTTMEGRTLRMAIENLRAPSGAKALFDGDLDGWKLIESSVIGGTPGTAVSEVEFTGLDSAYKDLFILGTFRISVASGSFLVQINGKATSGYYDHAARYCYGSTASLSGDQTTAGHKVLTVETATNPVGGGCSISFGVGGGNGLIRSSACHVDGSNLRLYHTSSRTRSGAGTITAISSIKLLMTTGGFHYGSEFRLYRRG